jgi:hypothetical protein
MRRDLFNNCNVKPLFPPAAAVVADIVQVSLTIDRSGYEGLSFFLVTGVLTDPDAVFNFVLEDGDDPALVDVAQVVAPNMLGTEVLASFNFASDNKCFKIGYLGAKRYVRARITPVGNTGNLFVAGVAVLSGPKISPTPNPPT